MALMTTVEMPNVRDACLGTFHKRGFHQLYLRKVTTLLFFLLLPTLLDGYVWIFFLSVHFCSLRCGILVKCFTKAIIPHSSSPVLVMNPINHR